MVTPVLVLHEVDEPVLGPVNGYKDEVNYQGHHEGRDQREYPCLPNAVTIIPKKIPMKGLMYPNSRLVRSQSEGSYSEINAIPYRLDEFV